MARIPTLHFGFINPPTPDPAALLTNPPVPSPTPRRSARINRSAPYNTTSSAPPKSLPSTPTRSVAPTPKSQNRRKFWTQQKTPSRKLFTNLEDLSFSKRIVQSERNISTTSSTRDGSPDPFSSPFVTNPSTPSEAPVSNSTSNSSIWNADKTAIVEFVPINELGFRIVDNTKSRVSQIGFMSSNERFYGFEPHPVFSPKGLTGRKKRIKGRKCFAEGIGIDYLGGMHLVFPRGYPSTAPASAKGNLGIGKTERFQSFRKDVNRILETMQFDGRKFPSDATYDLRKMGTPDWIELVRRCSYSSVLPPGVQESLHRYEPHWDASLNMMTTRMFDQTKRFLWHSLDRVIQYCILQDRQDHQKRLARDIVVGKDWDRCYPISEIERNLMKENMVLFPQFLECSNEGFDEEE